MVSGYVCCRLYMEDTRLTDLTYFTHTLQLSSVVSLTVAVHTTTVDCKWKMYLTEDWVTWVVLLHFII